MTPTEFKEKAQEFARMYVSDYARGDVVVKLDEPEEGEEPRGAIEFETYRDEGLWRVPICVGGKNNDELELDLPDTEGYELDARNFWVYLWFEATKRADAARDALATEQQARESNHEKLAKALAMDPLDPLTGQEMTPSMFVLVATARTQGLRVYEAQVERLLERLAEALYDLESGESALEFGEQTDDVKDAYRRMAKEEKP
jgi:hypothetical protein